MGKRRTENGEKTTLGRGERPNYLNRKELKQIGWTDALIGKFLGRADKFVANPFTRGGPPMQLFLKARPAGQGIEALSPHAGISTAAAGTIELPRT